MYFFATAMQMNTHYNPRCKAALFALVARPLSVILIISWRSMTCDAECLCAVQDRSSTESFHGCVCSFSQGNFTSCLLAYRAPRLPMEWCTKWWTPPGKGCSCCEAQAWCCASRCPVPRQLELTLLCLLRQSRTTKRNVKKVQSLFCVLGGKMAWTRKSGHCHTFGIPWACVWGWARQGRAVFYGKTYSCFFQVGVFKTLLLLAKPQNIFS